MGNALLVRSREAVRELQRQLDRLARRDRPCLQPLSECLALEQLGNDVRRLPLRAEVEHGEDVGVIERRRRAGFLLESFEAIAMGGKGTGQHLDRDVAPESRVACTIDLAHAACADGRHDFVRPEASARLEGH
jgi:hypothetical protein